MKLYPELRLRKENFEMWKWKSPAMQRSFFDRFARSKHFSPLDTEKWYSVTKKEIIRAGGSGLLKYYNGSNIEAMVKLYPELIWKKGNFFRHEARKFLEEFAMHSNFNPLDAEKWGSVTRREIMQAGGQRLVLKYGSHIKALMKLYPELRLNFLEIIRAGGSGLLKYYNGSHVKALMELNPELRLKKEKKLRSKGGARLLNCSMDRM